MEPVVGHNLCPNFGNIRDYSEQFRVLLEQRGAMSVLLFHSLPPCLEPVLSQSCFFEILAGPRSWDRPLGLHEPPEK